MGDKLHLGCGKRYLPGYCHIDLSDYPHIAHKHDIRTLPMVKDSSVALIYASHVLEYFDREEAIIVLQEWFRKLEPGGILRVAVPDFRALAKVYLHYGDLNLVVGPLYGKWNVDVDTTIYHKTVYDYVSLQRLFMTIGFSAVKKWDWQDVFVDALERYDDYSKAYVPHMNFKNGTLISLNVEGIK
jgi:predicted SAM-dependent methyltransferase